MKPGLILAFAVVLCAMLCAVLCGCENVAPAFALPAQRPSFDGFPPRAVRVVNMADLNATGHIVRDIPPGEGPWRWTQQKPAIKIRVRANEGMKFTIDFSLPEVTFRDTGPVTMTFLVNDHVVDRVRFTTPGEKHYEKPIPAEWIPVNQEAVISAEIDKLWVSKADGGTLGFILTRMGLKL